MVYRIETKGVRINDWVREGNGLKTQDENGYWVLITDLILLCKEE